MNIISSQQLDSSVEITDMDREAILSIFGTPNVSSTTEFGAPIYINEKGDCLCVPYYDCDADMKIIKDGKADGFGTIDIRLV